MRNMTCIVCPIGCSLEIKEDAGKDLTVSGNHCPRGASYAVEEIRAPKRVVTATCGIDELSIAHEHSKVVRRVPVKTASACLRQKIPSLLKEIYKTKVTLPVKTGDIIISKWDGEIDVVATRTVN